METSVCSSPGSSRVPPPVLLTWALSATREGALHSVRSPPPLVPAPGRSRPHKCSAAMWRSGPRATGEPPPRRRRPRARMEELSPPPGRCYWRPGRPGPPAPPAAPRAPLGPAEPWRRPRPTLAGALERGSRFQKRVLVRFLTPPVRTRQGRLAKKAEASKEGWRERARLRGDVRRRRHHATPLVRGKRSVHLLLQVAQSSFSPVLLLSRGSILQTCSVINMLPSLNWPKQIEGGAKGRARRCNFDIFI